MYKRQYVDRTNLPIPPKTTIELYKRTDPEYIKIWDEALRKEWDGLCEREVFEHDLTKQQLYDRGILPGKRLIGIRVIYETKVKNGEFERCKCRAVAQGFGFKKTDFDSCFAAAPSLQSNRLISALCAVLGWTRVTFDINQAYLLGRAPPSASAPISGPARCVSSRITPTPGYHCCGPSVPSTPSVHSLSLIHI